MKITYFVHAHQIGDIVSLDAIMSLPEGTHFSLRSEFDIWDTEYVYWREGVDVRYYEKKSYAKASPRKKEAHIYTCYRWFSRDYNRTQEFLLI